jgi:hypothetical protein
MYNGQLDIWLRQGLKSTTDTYICTIPKNLRWLNTASTWAIRYSYRKSLFWKKYKRGKLDFKKALEIELHPDNINREDGLSQGWARKPLIHVLKERRPSNTKELTPYHGLYKWLTSLSYHPPSTPLLTPVWSHLIGLAQSLPHLVLTGPIPQTSPPDTLYNASEPQLITSALKMETAHFSKTLATINHSTWHLNPKQHHHFNNAVVNPESTDTMKLFTNQIYNNLCVHNVPISTPNYLEYFYPQRCFYKQLPKQRLTSYFRQHTTVNSFTSYYFNVCWCLHTLYTFLAMDLSLLNAWIEPCKDSDFSYQFFYKFDDVKKSFYEELGHVFDQFPRYQAKSLLGNFNAKVDREDIFEPTIRNMSLHKISNDNGVWVENYATSKNFVVKSTLFLDCNIHKYIWTSPKGQVHNQTDHVSTDRKWHSSILDIWSFTAADSDSKH